MAKKEEDSRILVVTDFCPQCGSETFIKTGKIAVDGVTGYKRAICKKGCGWVGDMILESTGKAFSVPKDEDAKEGNINKTGG